MSIRILLADDHRILREGLRSLFAQEPDMSIVGEAGSGEEAVGLARQLRPDLVIMDVVLPGVDGVEATRRIRADLQETRVIALSMHSERRYVSQMLRAGAIGYVVKDSAFEELSEAVRAVMAGGPGLSAGVSRALVGDLVPPANPHQPPAAAPP